MNLGVRKPNASPFEPEARYEEDVSSAIDEAGILEDLAPYLLPDDDDSPPSHPLLGLPACQQHTSGASVEITNKAAREGKRTPRREQRAEHAPSPGRRNGATQIAGHAPSPSAHTGLNKEEEAFTKILDACRSPPHDLLNASKSYVGPPLCASVGLKPALSVSPPRGNVPVPLAPHGAPIASVVSSLHSLESAYVDPLDSVVGELSTAFRVTHEDIVPRPDDWTGGEAAQSCLCGVWDHSTNRAMQQRHGPATRVQEEQQDAEAVAEEREVEAFLEGLQRDMGGLKQIAHTLLSEHQRLRERGLELPSEPLLHELVQ